MFGRNTAQACILGLSFRTQSRRSEHSRKHKRCRLTLNTHATNHTKKIILTITDPPMARNQPNSTSPPTASSFFALPSLDLLREYGRDRNPTEGGRTGNPLFWGTASQSIPKCSVPDCQWHLQVRSSFAIQCLTSFGFA